MQVISNIVKQYNTNRADRSVIVIRTNNLGPELSKSSFNARVERLSAGVEHDTVGEEPCDGTSQVLRPYAILMR